MWRTYTIIFFSSLYWYHARKSSLTLSYIVKHVSTSFLWEASCSLQYILILHRSYSVHICKEFLYRLFIAVLVALNSEEIFIKYWRYETLSNILSLKNKRETEEKEEIPFSTNPQTCTSTHINNYRMIFFCDSLELICSTLNLRW